MVLKQLYGNFPVSFSNNDELFVCAESSQTVYWPAYVKDCWHITTQNDIYDVDARMFLFFFMKSSYNFMFMYTIKKQANDLVFREPFPMGYKTCGVTRAMLQKVLP